VCAAAATAPGVAQTGSWVEFDNQTASRISADPSVGVSDVNEKDYAWGDVDDDGDLDLVCVRKQPFTSPGRRANVLFMNENGVLVDRTGAYATISNVPGTWDDPQDGLGNPQPERGFLTPTNDRDVLLVDLTGDGWLDIVTATTISDDAPKHIGHPRIYRNLGEVGGLWQGFTYEQDRIPQLYVGGNPVNPRFCSVAAGDVNGDGALDLFFGDYDSSGAGGSSEPPGMDMNDRLLINNGAGYFTDQSTSRMTSTSLLSAFSASAAIVDLNGDGARDIVKNTALSFPQEVRVAYNDPMNVGSFLAPSNPVTIYNLSAYFISVGDLNGDGKLDVVVTDDGPDRFLLNTGNNASGHALFNSRTFAFQLGAGSDDGFGGGSRLADLNNDGFLDALIADVDVDISGCARRLHMYRNLGYSQPGEIVTLQDQVPSPIPYSDLTGTFDAAVFDINGDGWLDVVLGRCGGTTVWINEPPAGLAFSYPQGLPGFVGEQPTTFQVQVTAVGAAIPLEDTGTLHYAIDGGSYSETAMVHLGSNLYQATLPAVTCPGTINFYLSASTTSKDVFTDPSGAPGSAYTAVAAAGTTISLRDEMEGDVSGWTITNAVGMTTGMWEVADPNGTISNSSLCAPEDDATAGVGIMAFVTDNGPVGGALGANDVDGGPTWLMSPRIDLSGTDATISYSRWFFCTDFEVPAEQDFFQVEVSNNDGQSWVTVENIPHVGSLWITTAFIVSDYVAPTANVRVRFSTQDNPNNSFTEAGVDNFQVEEFVCCAADIANGDGMVDVSDLLALLAVWDTDNDAADFDNSGLVDVSDLLYLLSEWGSCL
jgi:hypothetical protein